MKFDTLEYLLEGNEKQRVAYDVLFNKGVFEKLTMFDPILVGTIPLAIDVVESDLDIICCFHDKEVFISLLNQCFSDMPDFRMNEVSIQGMETVILNFKTDYFDIEIFGQAVPTKEQPAYRHMLTEHKILEAKGEAFRKQIIDLKKKGYKTEPAFAMALGLPGDPYVALLNFPINQQS